MVDSNRRVGWAVVVAAAAAFFVVGGAGAVMHNGEKTSPRPVGWAKLSSSLAAVARAELDGGRGLQIARTSGLRIQNGRVQVVVEARTTRSKAAAAVVAVRGVVVASHADLVQAYVAPAALLALSRADAVAYLRSPRAPSFG